MKALITGAEGFIGHHMIAHLLSKDVETVASTQHILPDREFPEGVKHWACDVTDPHAVGLLIREVDPTVIIHLAGQAYVQKSFEDPSTTFAINAMGTLNVLEAMRRHAPKATMVLAGSGTEYGAPARVPTPESSPLRPTSPYAASKVAAEVLCGQYYEAHGIRAVTARIFGTTGPGKTGDFINDVASQIADREAAGSKKFIEVGDVAKRRDIMDVRDCVGALYTIARHGRGGRAYNVGSGKAYVIASLLMDLIGLSTKTGLKSTSVKELIRDVDEPVHWADIVALTEMGWRQTKTIQETLLDVLNHQRRLRMVASL